jgi:hypothetical protein
METPQTTMGGKQMKTTTASSDRVVLGIDFVVRQYGYRWALLREIEGQEWRNWESENRPGEGVGKIMRGLWYGFAQGVRDFSDRLEMSSLDDLLEEEQIIRNHSKRQNIGHFGYDSALDLLEATNDD